MPPALQRRRSSCNRPRRGRSRTPHAPQRASRKSRSAARPAADGVCWRRLGACCSGCQHGAAGRRSPAAPPAAALPRVRSAPTATRPRRKLIPTQHLGLEESVLENWMHRKRLLRPFRVRGARPRSLPKVKVRASEARLAWVHRPPPLPSPPRPRPPPPAQPAYLAALERPDDGTSAPWRAQAVQGGRSRAARSSQPADPRSRLLVAPCALPAQPPKRRASRGRSPPPLLWRGPSAAPPRSLTPWLRAWLRRRAPPAGTRSREERARWRGWRWHKVRLRLLSAALRQPDGREAWSDCVLIPPCVPCIETALRLHGGSD